MDSKLKELNFKGIWRPYQKRVLCELDVHLDDKKLNVVAAPGAGKTILGIEVIRRLGKPALIFAPTVTIRNQWAQRIEESFISDKKDTNIISTNIYNVKKITIVTYQALHCISKRREDFSAFIADLKEQEIETILFDEAHHLKIEWHKTLLKLIRKIDEKNCTFVSLTATPPYNVNLAEWEKYHTLCGPVDAEVSVPELVKNGNLCPHQDLICFCDLVQDEVYKLEEFEANRKAFFEYLKTEADFIFSIKVSSFLNDFEENIELIYKDNAFTISLISYLLNEDSMLKEAYYLAEFLGVDVSLIPEFDYTQAEILFNGYLGKFKSCFVDVYKVFEKLKEFGLLEKSDKVDFLGRSRLKNIFLHSKNRLKAVEEITNFEYNVLGDNLREVILLDYINKGENLGVNVVSVFEKLKNNHADVGILSGSLIVIPKSAVTSLLHIFKDFNYSKKDVSLKEYGNGFYSLECSRKVDVVSVVTELFAMGAIKILVGTQALLGEGWDAPCINTLIIASTISSFVTSNQMRGRALRIDKENPQKTANIWHIATMRNCGFSLDYDSIVKRFETFEGVSYIENAIKSGIERLGLPQNICSLNNFDKLNAKMFSRAGKRNELPLLWQQVFDKSAITEEIMTQQIYDVVETKKTKIPAIFIKKNVSKIEKYINSKAKEHYLNITLREHFLLASYLYKTLFVHNVLKSKNAKINIKPDESNLSYVITVSNCTNYERNLFLKAYNEIFTPNENARYIFKKETDYSSVIELEKHNFKFFNIFALFSSEKYVLPSSILKPSDYYFIPEVVGKNKYMVETFLDYLSTDFGYINKIYTRIPQGRKELLNAICLMKGKEITKKSRCWL